jgi:hypothetical protein
MPLGSRGPKGNGSTTSRLIFSIWISNPCLLIQGIHRRRIILVIIKEFQVGEEKFRKLLVG